MSRIKNLLEKYFFPQKVRICVVCFCALKPYGESNPAVVQEKPPKMFSKTINGRQIHLILTQLKTYGASSTKMRTKVTASLAKHTSSKLKGAARSVQQRLKNVMQI